MSRFTIREVVLLTLVTGMGLGWFCDHRRMANRLSIALVALRESGGSGGYHAGYFYAFIGENIAFDRIPPEDRMAEYQRLKRPTISN
jgi:hypothetical protein